MKVNAKEAYEKFHLISEVGIEEVRAVFDSVLTALVLNFAENESTVIPGIGNLTIHYEGEEFIKDGKQAKISIEIDPDDSLKRNIGQVIDKIETDVEKRYKARIKGILSEILTK